MTDRELLEFAAKAAGLDVIADAWDGLWVADYEDEWNPLTDDGDALRLAVNLEMLVHTETCYYVTVCKEVISVTEHIGNDGQGCIYAATRRAIVRAAAEIGKTIDD